MSYDENKKPTPDEDTGREGVALRDSGGRKEARPEQGAAPKGESFTDSSTGVEIRLADLLKALE